MRTLITERCQWLIVFLLDLVTHLVSLIVSSFFNFLLMNLLFDFIPISIYIVPHLFTKTAKNIVDTKDLWPSFFFKLDRFFYFMLFKCLSKITFSFEFGRRIWSSKNIFPLRTSNIATSFYKKIEGLFPALEV